MTFLTVPPLFYRDLIVASYKAGAIDRWEAWRILWNGGLRGRELALAMGFMR